MFKLAVLIMCIAGASATAPFKWDKDCGSKFDRLDATSLSFTTTTGKIEGGADATILVKGDTNLHGPLMGGSWSVRIYEIGESDHPVADLTGDLMQAIKFLDDKNTTFQLTASGLTLPMAKKTGVFQLAFTAQDFAKASYYCLDVFYNLTVTPSVAEFVAADPNTMTYHIVNAFDNHCSESSYTDANLAKQGWLEGACDARFNAVLDVSNSTVCTGHSEENLKFCPGHTTVFVVTKKGITKAIDDVSFALAEETTSPTDEVAVVEAEIMNPSEEATYSVFHKIGYKHCYEVQYIDANYRSVGYIAGSCPSKYTTIDDKTPTTICDGHSEVNIKDCKGKTRTITITKKGEGAPTPKPPASKYHLEGADKKHCWEIADYIDAHYESIGFVAGACDNTYTSVDGTTKAVICDGHSEDNVKTCPESRRTIVIAKKGHAKSLRGETTFDATAAAEVTVVEAEIMNPSEEATYSVFHKIGYKHCYEVQYIDANYRSVGYIAGSCPSKYTTIDDKTPTTICDGHSEVNIKDCKGKTRTITITKKGEGAPTPKPPASKYHLEGADKKHCWEIADYIDAHYESIGFVAGACDNTYTSVDGTTKAVICDGHSEDNVKTCPESRRTIVIAKKGHAKAVIA